MLPKQSETAMKRRTCLLGTCLAGHGGSRAGDTRPALSKAAGRRRPYDFPCDSVDYVGLFPGGGEHRRCHAHEIARGGRPGEVEHRTAADAPAECPIPVGEPAVSGRHQVDDMPPLRQATRHLEDVEFRPPGGAMELTPW